MAKPEDEREKSDLVVGRVPEELERSNEPPVVARLIVEIRSDGSRTIARGALDDAQRGERVAIEARGDSPIQLAIALARALSRLPLDFVRKGTGSLGSGDTRARTGVRGLLGRRRDK